MATEVLEKELMLTVNQRKTHLASLDEGGCLFEFCNLPKLYPDKGKQGGSAQGQVEARHAKEHAGKSGKSDWGY